MPYLSREDIEATRALTSRQAARVLGTGKTSINKYRKIYSMPREIELPQARVLTLDIETKPGVYYSWGPKADWLAMPFEIEPPSMICFAAKWLGESETMFYRGEEAVRMAHKLLSEADLVVTYNGDRYDLRRLNNEFLKLGMAPPRPYRSIDLIKTNRKQFDLPYRKLDYLAQATGTGSKVQTGGFDLWRGCMADDPEAWKLMEEYNIADVVLTESLYIKLLPWLTGVPHMGMFVAEGACPYCGSDSLTADGETQALVQKYELFNCDNCQGWSRGNKPIRVPIETRRA